MEIFKDPLFWVFVAFFIFIASVFQQVKEKLFSFLDKRAQTIRLDLENAHKLFEDAQMARNQLLIKYEKSFEEAKNVIEQAKEDAIQLQKNTQRELENFTQRKEEQLLSRIQQSERNAILEIRHQVLELAFFSTQRILSHNLSKQDSDPLMDQALEKLPDQLKWTPEEEKSVL